jgi:biofilm PGA synthesis lipoprotein PgaB
VNRRALLGALALGAARGAGAAKLPPVHPRARGHFSAVLMWHDVVAGAREVWFDTPVAELEAQFRAIRRLGLTPVTLERLADHLETGAAIPSGAVVLTFDDNTIGLYRHLPPLLRRFGWPAVVFVHTAYVGVRTGKDHCTWAQLREMEAGGLIRAQPHTVTHPADMRRLSREALARELRGSRAALEKHLGGSRRFFAYSNGFHDARVAGEALAAGYRLAITEDWGAAQRSPNLMQLRRYSMHKRADQALRDTARAAGRKSEQPDGPGVMEV